MPAPTTATTTTTPTVADQITTPGGVLAPPSEIATAAETAGNTILDALRLGMLDLGLPETYAGPIVRLILIVLTAIVCWIVFRIIRQILIRTITRVVKNTKHQWDDVLYEQRVFRRLAHIIPPIIIYLMAWVAFAGLPTARIVFQNLSLIYLILILLAVADALLNAIRDIINLYDFSEKIPVRGITQAIKIILFFIGAIYIVALLLNESPWVFITGLGALTAVLLLVFKDLILGFVASIQLTTNDMVRVGDWVEMPKYGADGDVTDISLTSVKVRNWDKTITTIPTYAMVSNDFKNWRGMKESGGRRIKRAINIDMTTIDYCNAEMIERFKKIQVLRDYIERKQREIEDYNRKYEIDDSELVNGRRITNVGTFRAYIVEYLRRHPKVHQGMTFLVRHLPPTEYGLPIEIYVFCTDQVWANYEAIQADIFDHILAAAPHFNLRVFQNPSGYDIRNLVESMAGTSDNQGSSNR